MWAAIGLVYADLPDVAAGLITTGIAATVLGLIDWMQR